MEKNEVSFLLFAFLFFTIIPFSFSYNEIPVTRLTFMYDKNFETFDLFKLKTTYDYVTTPDSPGNATVIAESKDGNELFSVRVAFLPPHIILMPVYGDDNAGNGGSEIEDREFAFSDVSVPYSEELAVIKVILDENNATFDFNILKRLCNNNGNCDREESTLSCFDCELDEKDGVCNWHRDHACDPDCALGVDPDCLIAPPKPTQGKTTEPKATPASGQGPIFTPSPEATESPGYTPGVQTPSFDFTWLIIIVIILLLAVVFFYWKTQRGK